MEIQTSGKRKEEEEIHLEFLENFEQHHNIFRKLADQIITKEEWWMYYENVSIDDDKYFEVMINNAWRITLLLTTKTRVGPMIVKQRLLSKQEENSTGKEKTKL